MKNDVLVIFDMEEEYANHLMEYIGDKRGMPFRTLVFTKKDEMHKYLKENHVDILLISSNEMSKEISEYDIEKIILLSDGRILSEYIGYDSIFKFKSAENIVREVLDYFVELKKDDEVLQSRKKGEIIGVYSPVGRCGKTVLSVAMGEVLATEYKTLYINLEACSAFRGMVGPESISDLSDLMYYYKQNPETVSIKLQAVVQSFDNLDYVLPIFYSKDLREVETSEWIGLINRIARSDTYEKIVVDVGNMIGDVVAFLENCDKVIMPGLSDDFSIKKIEFFEKNISDEHQELIEKIQKVEVPDLGDKLYEMTPQMYGVSKLGEFVKNEIRL